MLIGVSRNATTGDLKMYQTDMKLELDVDMDNIVGTTDGRVFMTGVEDGNVYELYYQASEGWFSRRIRLVNITLGPMAHLLPKMFGFQQSGTFFALKYKHCIFTVYPQIRSFHWLWTESATTCIPTLSPLLP